MRTQALFKTCVWLAAFAGTITAAVSWNAASAERTIAVPAIGRGTERCRDWTLHRYHDLAARKEDLSWIFGFYSGQNEFAPVKPKKWLMFSYDEPNLTDYVDRQCQKTPDARVADVAADLLPYAK